MKFNATGSFIHLLSSTSTRSSLTSWMRAFHEGVDCMQNQLNLASIERLCSIGRLQHLGPEVSTHMKPVRPEARGCMRQNKLAIKGRHW